MAGIPSTHGLHTILVCLVLAIARIAVALNIAYCSTDNTGSNFAAVNNHWQSNGACFETCNGNYAFAILRGSDCWCSNYVPADTTSTDSCNQPCPGYPSDLCGSSSDDLFAYIALRNSPSGTAGASSSPTSTSVPSPSTSTVTSVDSQVVSSHSFEATSTSSSLAPSSFSTPSPITRTILMQPVPSSSFATSTRAISISSTSTSSTSTTSTSSNSPSYTKTVSSIPNLLTLSSQSSSATPSPVTVLETVTASPSVQISSVFITPSTTANVQTTQAISSSTTTVSSTTTSSTSITPTSPASTTSTTAAVALIPSTPATTFSTTWIPTPMTSVITVTGQVKTITIIPTQPAAATGVPIDQQKSDGGFLTHTGKVVGLFVGVALIFLIIAALAIWLFLRRRRNRAAAAVAPNRGAETPQRRPSRLSQMGLVGQTTGEKSLPSIRTSGWGPSIGDEKSADDTTPADGRRTSFPRIVDQRLDPVTVWNPIHANGSHVSVRSFRDDQDYSRRMLRVANPDQ